MAPLLFVVASLLLLLTHTGPALLADASMCVRAGRGRHRHASHGRHAARGGRR